ncbi:helix-turn-helix domain-containing protein [Quadrisphaera sp. KR29]|uniref:helix-turn-helix domain-containing protein n=1 Tax=Quadrisphaera sp. KR29 TaxID=3461391 RepID=UPI004043D7AF
MPQQPDQPIGVTERTGALVPSRLALYEPGWVHPTPGLEEVVDRYWHVRWQLPTPITERIIDVPAITLTIEAGEVPAPLVLTGPATRAWQRTLTGSGDVFAVRLQPAGLAVVSDLDAHLLVDAVVPVTEQLDARLHRMMAAIAGASTVADRVQLADEVLAAALAERAPGSAQLLANRVVQRLRAEVHPRAGEALGEVVGVSQRSVQRALSSTLGRGPKWVARRVRLQEVALALASTDEGLAEMASRLGYTDQAHLTRDFRAVAGISPGQHRRTVRG